MDINEKLDVIMDMLREHDKRFDAIDKKFEAIDKKFEAIDRKFEAIDKKFEAIDKKFESIDKKFEAIDKKFESIDKKFEAIDIRFNILTGTIKENHEKTMALLNSLNSAFIRFEAECSDKFSILFDMNQDYIEHKKIFANELSVLKKSVKNNSFRISNLEKAIQ